MSGRNPSDHATSSMTKSKQVSDSVAQREREEVKLRTAIDTVLQTEAGRVLWRWLFHNCGYNVSSLVRRTDGEIADLATQCKEAQRLIYVRLRVKANLELLHKAEVFAETIETPETGGKENGRSVT